MKAPSVNGDLEESEQAQAREPTKEKIVKAHQRWGCSLRGCASFQFTKPMWASLLMLPTGSRTGHSVRATMSGLSGTVRSTNSSDAPVQQFLKVSVYRAVS
jgi:hypothetical protein